MNMNYDIFFEAESRNQEQYYSIIIFNYFNYFEI